MLNRCLIKGRAEYSKLRVDGVAMHSDVGVGCAAAGCADDFGDGKQVDGFSSSSEGQAGFCFATTGCGCDRRGAESVANQRQGRWYYIVDHFRRSR